MRGLSGQRSTCRRFHHAPGRGGVAQRPDPHVHRIRRQIAVAALTVWSRFEHECLPVFRSSLQSLSIRAGVAAATLSVSGCVTSQMLIGEPRAPIPADQVQLCLQPPTSTYQEIAIIDSSSKYSWAFSAGAKNEVVIRRLKEAAAKLGANGILLQEITDSPIESLGAAAGTEFVGARGTVELGLGGSVPLSEKYGRAIAIWLERTGEHPP